MSTVASAPFSRSAPAFTPSAEIDRKLDEIVAFAEIEKFADTPVKHYSSGMYVRLAFAVAAHLEPEILLVDEVLAVGDAGFQRKCIGKLDEVAREGRTVLFVSHNMQAVSRLCSRGLLLDDGKIGFDGLPTAAISKYLDDGRAVQSIRKCSEPGEGDDRIRIVEIRLVDELGQTVDTVDIRRPVGVSVRFRVVGASGATLQMSLTNEHRIHVLWTSDHLFRNDEIRKGGEYVETAWIPGNFLAEGRFSVNVGFVTFRPHQMHVWLPDAISFFVKDSYEGDSLRGDYGGELAGVTRPELKWTLVSED
jgi:lipopolysaccharide transport system ATP-binding protein